MYCVNCGNKIDSNNNYCTNCGVKVSKGNSVDGDIISKKNDTGLRIASIILGVLSIICSVTVIFFVYGFIMGIVGLVIGIFALKKGKNLAGIILNVVGLVLSIVVFGLFIWLIFEVSDGNYDYDHYYNDNGYFENFKDIIDEY